MTENKIIDDHKDFSQLVGMALGRASVAWTESPQGIFDSTVCASLAKQIIEEHEHLLEHARASSSLKLKIAEEALEYIIEHELYHGVNQGRASEDIAKEALARIREGKGE